MCILCFVVGGPGAKPPEKNSDNVSGSPPLRFPKIFEKGGPEGYRQIDMKIDNIGQFPILIRDFKGYLGNYC